MLNRLFQSSMHTYGRMCILFFCVPLYAARTEPEIGRAYAIAHKMRELVEDGKQHEYHDYCKRFKDFLRISHDIHPLFIPDGISKRVSAAEYLLKNGEFSFTAMLIEKYPGYVSLVDEKGFTLLHNFCIFFEQYNVPQLTTSMYYIVQNCMQHINQPTHAGNTPIMFADNPYLIAALYMRGAHINHINNSGKSFIGFRPYRSLSRYIRKIVTGFLLGAQQEALLPEVDLALRDVQMSDIRAIQDIIDSERTKILQHIAHDSSIATILSARERREKKR